MDHVHILYEAFEINDWFYHSQLKFSFNLHIDVSFFYINISLID